MRGGLGLVVLFTWVGLSSSFWLDLDLELDTALSRGKPFDQVRNTGQYLRDSFRKEILNPSIDKIVKAIKIIQKNDQRNEGVLMAVSGIVVAAVGYLAVSLRCQRKKKMNSVMVTENAPAKEATAKMENFNVKIASS